MKKTILVMLAIFAATSAFAIGKWDKEDNTHTEETHNDFDLEYYEEKYSIEKYEDGYAVFHYKIPKYRYENCQHTFVDESKVTKNFVRSATETEIKKFMSKKKSFTSLHLFTLFLVVFSALFTWHLIGFIAGVVLPKRMIL